MTYAGTDFYMTDRLLSDEERDIRDAVRQMVDERILPTIGDHFIAGTFPTELIPVFGEMGLLGSSLKGYGCAGLGPVAYGLILQELERGDSGIRSFVSGLINKEIVVAAQVDESILGGLIIQVGDQLLDGSTRTQLENLRKQIRSEAAPSNA